VSNESEAQAGEFLPAMGEPRVEEARAAVRALLAPTRKDLEVLLINLHRESAQSQRKARKSQRKVRHEVYLRLEREVAEVTTRELIGMMEGSPHHPHQSSDSQQLAEIPAEIYQPLTWARCRRAWARRCSSGPRTGERLPGGWRASGDEGHGYRSIVTTGPNLRPALARGADAVA
jgi:hypothetical protein